MSTHSCQRRGIGTSRRTLRTYVGHIQEYSKVPADSARNPYIRALDNPTRVV